MFRIKPANTWLWLLLVALAVGLATPMRSAEAAKPLLEEELFGQLDEALPDEEVVEDLFDVDFDDGFYDDPETIEAYLILVETLAVEMDNVLIAVDQLYRGEQKACRTLNYAVDWMQGLLNGYVDVPWDYYDNADGVFVGLIRAYDGLEAPFYVCNNGVVDALTPLHYAVTRSALQDAHGILRSKSAEAQAQAGMTVQADGALLALYASLFYPEVGPFSAEVFRADVEITIQTLQYMAGWIDRYNGGGTVYCIEYLYYIFRLEAARFTDVPDVYQYWTDEHADLLNLVRDTSLPLIGFCFELTEDQPAPQFMIDQARHGLARAIDRAHAVLQNIPE